MEPSAYSFAERLCFGTTQYEKINCIFITEHCRGIWKKTKVCRCLGIPGYWYGHDRYIFINSIQSGFYFADALTVISCVL